MLGKRRFIVILVGMGLVTAIEYMNGGWSATGQLAMLGIVGTYFGFDMGRAIKGASVKGHGEGA